jgi:hypothetical protein
MSYKEKILHPFLIAIFPIIYLYSETINEVPPQQMVLPIILMLIFSTVFVIIVRFIFKDWKKSALVVSLSLVLFILYSPVFAYLSGAFIGDFEIGRHRYLVIIFVIPFFTLAYLIYKTKIQLGNVTLILNAVAISLILISSVNIGIYTFEKSFYENDKNIEIVENKTLTPDIYFILLDAYAGEKVLKKYYNFDNSNFINSLRDRGFFVHNESYSNYANTIPSLGSTFNMEYFDVDDKYQRIYSMLPQSTTVKLLDLNGYKIIDFQKHSIAFDIPVVDSTLCKNENNRYTDTRLLDQLLKYTPLSTIIPIVPPEQDMETQLCLFAELPNTKNMFDEPTFVFAHSLVTHSPYYYGPNGEEVNPPSMDYEHYVYSIEFANKNMVKIIDELLDVENHPIIIVLGDHGTVFLNDDITYEEKIITSHQNLYAIYFPDQNYELVEKTSTAINIFRIIFNQFFNADYDLLEDKTFSSNTGEWYNLDDTTHITINNKMN